MNRIRERAWPKLGSLMPNAATANLPATISLGMGGMLDQHHLTLREVDQARADFAAIKDELDK